MKSYPISDLRVCSVKNCRGETVTIIQKRIGLERLMYGYCQFHAIISATFFTQEDRQEIPFLKLGG